MQRTKGVNCQYNDEAQNSHYTSCFCWLQKSNPLRQRNNIQIIQMRGRMGSRIPGRKISR